MYTKIGKEQCVLWIFTNKLGKEPNLVWGEGVLYNNKLGFGNKSD